LTSNDEAVNKDVKTLGDRTLAGFIGAESQIYAFATYSYTDMNGGGNANIYKTVKYGTELNQWHFVYFAYSTKERKAISFI